MTTDLVLCEYHQFFLAPAGVDPVLDPSKPAELVQVTDDGPGLIVLTGIASGPVRLEVDSPTHTADAGWEEHSAVVMHIAEPLFVTAPTVMHAGSTAPVFSPDAPGEHQVTVLARGRDRQYDANLLPEAEPTEQYRIEITATGV